MSMAQGFIQELQMTLKFFNTTLSVFDEADSGFAAKAELYTVAGHVAHSADTVDWFVEGAFGAGWNMDFEAEVAKAKTVTSLSDAKKHLERAFANVAEVIGAAPDADLCAPIPDKKIMEGAPRCAIVSSITDHTARGSRLP